MYLLLVFCNDKLRGGGVFMIVSFIDERGDNFSFLIDDGDVLVFPDRAPEFVLYHVFIRTIFSR